MLCEKTAYTAKLERLYSLKLEQLSRARHNPLMLQVYAAEADAIHQELKGLCDK